MDSAGVLYSFTATDTLVTNDVIYSRKIGNKRYELTDHFGNVRATVSDVLLDHSGNPDAEVVSYTDYHPYGMAMTVVFQYVDEASESLERRMDT